MSQDEVWNPGYAPQRQGRHHRQLWSGIPAPSRQERLPGVGLRGQHPAPRAGRRSTDQGARYGLWQSAAKECPECQSVIHAAYSICPECGHEFPDREREKHDHRASTAGILTGEVTENEYDVTAVYFSIHHKKNAPSDHPCTMRVDYRCGLSDYHSEWVCPEHTGYARQKFEAWWKARVERAHSRDRGPGRRSGRSGRCGTDLDHHRPIGGRREVRPHQQLPARAHPTSPRRRRREGRCALRLRLRGRRPRAVLRMIAMEKTCFRCKRTLPIDEFYTHPAMADGHLNKCKECTRCDSQQNRRKRVDHYRQYDRERSQLPHRVTIREEYGRRQRNEEPEKYRARTMAGNALRDGRLRKEPCYFCGSMAEVEMHHPDYSQPLRVYWLCRTCHRKVDNMMKLGRRDACHAE